MKSDLLLEQITKNKNGDYYFIFRIKNVKRGIGHNQDELLIVGVPGDKFDDFVNNDLTNKFIDKNDLFSSFGSRENKDI